MTAYSARWAGVGSGGSGGSASATGASHDETGVSGTWLFDPDNGPVQSVTITGNTTITASGWPASSGTEAAVRLTVIQGGAGGYTVSTSGMSPLGETQAISGAAAGEIETWWVFSLQGTVYYAFDSAAVLEHERRIVALETFRNLPSVGDWWHPLTAGFNSAAITANNQLRSGPVIDVPKGGWSFDGFSFAWGSTAAAITGTLTFRVGFYSLVDRRKPGTLVAEFAPSGGETDHQASGTPSTNVVREVSCGTLTLAEGAYVLCCAFNGDMNGNHLYNASYFYRYRSSTLTDLWNTSASAQTAPCWTVSSVSGAMPASPTWAVANQPFPRILLHRSA